MSPRVRDRIAMTSVFLANGFGWGGFVGNLPRLKEAMGLSATAVGTLLLAVSTGGLVSMWLVGRFGPRLGTARLAGAGGLLVAAVLPLVALAPGWPSLLALAALLGFCSGGMDVAMNAQASQVERRWGLPLMSSFHAGWSLGGLAGSAVAGLCAKLTLGLGVALALPAAGVALLALPAFGQTQDPTAPRPAARMHLPSRAMLGLAAVACLCFTAEGAVADWSGIYLRTVLGAPQAGAAIVYSGFSVTMVAGRLAGDAVVRRLGPVRVVRLGAAVAVAGLGIGLLSPTALLAGVAFAAAGLGLANIVPLMFSAAGRIAGTAGIATAATCGYAGLMAGPPLLGAIADAAGLRAALLLPLLGIVAVGSVARVVEGPAVRR